VPFMYFFSWFASFVFLTPPPFPCPKRCDGRPFFLWAFSAVQISPLETTPLPPLREPFFFLNFFPLVMCPSFISFVVFSRLFLPCVVYRTFFFIFLYPFSIFPFSFGRQVRGRTSLFFFPLSFPFVIPGPIKPLRLGSTSLCRPSSHLTQFPPPLPSPFFSFLVVAP